MEKQKKVYRPAFEPSHPGLILKHGFVEEYNLKIEDVAKMLALSRIHLSRILNGHRPITHGLALKLEVLTQTPARQWLAMQEAYDTYMLSKNEDFLKYKSATEEWREKYLEASPKERQGSHHIIADLAKKAFGKNPETPSKNA